ncbi:hypothetical protein [Helcococcus kunzii]|uniref:hypothetical protein n=1 Tax=Helcococcus kunzii TaxID=40091 RepID=UPI0038AC496E
MTNLNTQKEIKNITKNLKHYCGVNFIDWKRDDFTILQPYDNGIALQIKKENGELSILISDNVVILEKKSGILDVIEEVKNDN